MIWEFVIVGIIGLATGYYLGFEWGLGVFVALMLVLFGAKIYWGTQSKTGAV